MATEACVWKMILSLDVSLFRKTFEVMAVRQHNSQILM